ncbi:MAG: hypothetical protein KJ057_13685 [Phycisphaerae bacterium]|nr:hypothetical protein [Planctomycetia bacterium]MCL4719516.1 hypothetical protein [Phycisphaerae bacterium]
MRAINTIGFVMLMGSAMTAWNANAQTGSAAPGQAATPAVTNAAPSATLPGGTEEQDRERLKQLRDQIDQDHAEIDAARDKVEAAKESGDKAAAKAARSEVKAEKAERKAHTQERKAIRARLRDQQ